MDVVEVLVLENLPLGRRVKLARIVKGWRQLDLAAATRLNPNDICNIELERPVYRWKMERVLQALELQRKPGEGTFITRMVGT